MGAEIDFPVEIALYHEVEVQSNRNVPLPKEVKSEVCPDISSVWWHWERDTQRVVIANDRLDEDEFVPQNAARKIYDERYIRPDSDFNEVIRSRFINGIPAYYLAFPDQLNTEPKSTYLLFEDQLEEWHIKLHPDMATTERSDFKIPKFARS